MNATKVTIGADPELFVFRDGVASSGIGLIGGSKDAPRWVDRGAVQEDNVLAEFNIYPASSEDEWVENINAVLVALRMILPEGTELRAISSYTYNLDDLKAWGPKAMEFGCEPDFYLNEVSRGVPDAGLRTAGGHVHIGYTNPSEQQNQNIIAACDILIGLCSVLYEDTGRRALYGGAGCFRNKEYGVEYRTPGNWWLANEDRMRWVYQRAQMAAAMAVSGDCVFDPDSKMISFKGKRIGYQLIQQVINTGDLDESNKMAEYLGVTPYTEQEK